MPAGPPASRDQNFDVGRLATFSTIVLRNNNHLATTRALSNSKREDDVSALALQGRPCDKTSRRDAERRRGTKVRLWFFLGVPQNISRSPRRCPRILGIVIFRRHQARPANSAMPQIPHPQRLPYELHQAVRDAAIGRTLALLSSGSIDIDQVTPGGLTPLMIAVLNGRSRVVGILLDKGANVSIASAEGVTALRISVEKGYLNLTRMLIDAGADPEAATSQGFTPLHTAAVRGYSEAANVLIEAGANPDSRELDGATPLYMAAQHGRSKVVSVLIVAGANPNSRFVDGSTPLYVAAQNGHIDAVRLLLRATADPLLVLTLRGAISVPLDAAAQCGRSEVVQELIQQVGVEGSGGASGGVRALELAAMFRHVGIMGMLMEAGVVDTGKALMSAVSCGRVESVKFLLQQNRAPFIEGGYVNVRADDGATPLLRCALKCLSPRIVRLLIDAGADTTSAILLANSVKDTPLGFVDVFIRQKIIGFKGILRGEDATEEQLHILEAIRRLLLRVEAVHATSWLWKSAAPRPTPAAAEVTSKTNASTTPLIEMLPILRRRARRPRVLLAALFR